MRWNIILIIGLILGFLAIIGYMESNFKPLGEYNLNATTDVHIIVVKLPQNTTKARIELENLTSTSNSSASFAVYTLKLYPLQGELISNYLKNPVDQAKFEIINSSSPLDRKLELNSRNAKCMVIMVNSGQGKAKVSTLQLF